MPDRLFALNSQADTAPVAAIIGFGDRGQKWARNASKAGHHVRVFDPNVEELPKTKPYEHCELLSKAVDDARVIIVTLPDRIALQRTVLQLLQSSVDQDQLVFVMTKDSSVETIQGCVKWPESIIRLDGTALSRVKLHASATNHSDAVQAAVAIMRSLGAKPVVVINDAPSPN